MTAALQRRFDVSKDLPLVFLGAALVPVTILLIVELFQDPWVFFQTLMKALALGSVYAIIALGFVLVFKATRTVNFSQGALGMAGALFLSFLIVDEHIPFTTVKNPLASIEPQWLAWLLCVVVALGVAAVLGLVIERLAIRPMVGQPLFSVAVITLGLEIVLRVFSIDAVKIQFRSLAVPWSNDGSFTSAGPKGPGSTGRTSRRWSPPRSRSSPCTSSTARAWGSRCGRSPTTRKRRWRRASTSGASSRSHGPPVRRSPPSAASSPCSRR